MSSSDQPNKCWGLNKRLGILLSRNNRHDQPRLARPTGRIQRIN
nr:hypothetical protein CoNPh38_CDS0305 [Staphylococcus phage S-CoN_Ph38]